MKDSPTSETITGFQKIIIQQIARHLDDDGCCRMTNAALARICSGVKKIRLHQEIGRLVQSGYLIREVDQQDSSYTNRRLWLTPKVQELMS